jgi:microsomal dipeptidase-like Zn-dependent dipeptidase
LYHKPIITVKQLFTGCLLLLATLTHAQSIDTNSLHGVIDFHSHTGPDATPRAINDLQLARLAKSAGMRGIVLKNHYTMTADRAELAMQEVGGIEVFGGIVLNRAVGGINAEAVNRMVQFDGHRGKVVWLPTGDSEYGVGHAPGHRPYVSVVKDGKPVPELDEIFKIIAQNNLVLETGHSSPEESLIIIAAAKQAGVKNIVVTHAMLQGANMEQMKQMAAMGAVIECCFQPGGLPGAKNAGKVSVPAFANAIKTIGAGHFLIDSDLGQKGNMLHPDGMRAFIAALKANGLTEQQIDLVARKNPATLLGLH